MERLRYPGNPGLDELDLRMGDYHEWKESWAKDVSVLEADGAYYVFSSDAGKCPVGYQVRRSFDLRHWEMLGNAFALEHGAALYAEGKNTEAYGNLSEAYRWCVMQKNAMRSPVEVNTSGGMRLLAPCVRQGKNGVYRMYYSMSACAGDSRSCIGLAEAERPEGPYTSVGLILCSPGGWRTPNALFPRTVTDEEGKLFLVYGSGGLGLFLLELDAETGLRKDGLDATKPMQYPFRDYFGFQLACGNIHGGGIVYQRDVPVYDASRLTWLKKNYYYLFCNYGGEEEGTIHCARSESVYGPYVDYAGNTLVCASDVGSGNLLLGAYGWSGEKGFDYYSPVYGDSYNGLFFYHARTHFYKAPFYVPVTYRKKFAAYYLLVSSYTFNAEGWPVLNPHRYAEERLCDVTQEELLSVSKGAFRAISLRQETGYMGESAFPKKIKLHASGRVSGAYSGEWRLYDTHYLDLVLSGVCYRGVVFPCWQEEDARAGLCISALNVQTGTPLFLRSV